MKKNNIEDPEDYLGNIADELGSMSSDITEIKTAQVNCATSSELKDYSEKVEGILTDGVIPIFERMEKMLTSPPKLHEFNLTTDGLANELSDGIEAAVKPELYSTVRQVIREGQQEFYAEEKRYLHEEVRNMRSEVRRSTSGHWWLVMPQWARITAIGGILGCIGFAIAFFCQVSANAKYRKMEWLYRYERVSYDNDGIKNMMLREEAMMVGTQQEQDSIKTTTVNLERRKHAERTHQYFRPSDDWTPETHNWWKFLK